MKINENKDGDIFILKKQTTNNLSEVFIIIKEQFIVRSEKTKYNLSYKCHWK